MNRAVCNELLNGLSFSSGCKRLPAGCAFWVQRMIYEKMPRNGYLHWQTNAPTWEGNFSIRVWRSTILSGYTVFMILLGKIPRRGVK